MMKSVLIVLASCLLSIQLTTSAPVHILDAEDGQVDLDNIAKNICWKNSGLHNQISRFSTIDKLIDYFDALPVEHQYSSCASRNLALLRQLQTLLHTDNDNVCSNEKLSLVESFHHNYISSQRRAQLIEAPKMIKTFFMHYVAQVSDMCAQRSERFFANTARTPVNVPAVDMLLEQYRKTVGAKASLDSYDDLFFVWGLVNGVPKKMRGKLVDYVVSGPKRMSVRTRDAASFLAIQQVCQDKLKPIYSSTLLPALRLIDLGYYPSHSGLLEQLNGNSFVNRLYKLTQLCETALPVQVLEAGDVKQTVLVKPEESDEEEEEEEESRGSVAGAEPASWTAQSLATVTESQAKLVAKRVAGDLAHRRRHLWKVIKRVVKGMKRAAPESVILAESNESFEESVADAVHRVDEVELRDTVEEDQEGDEKKQGLKRWRREIGKFGAGVVKVLNSIFRIAFIIIIFIIKLVIGLLTGTALLLATIASMDDVKDQLNQQLEGMDFNMKFN